MDPARIISALKAINARLARLEKAVFKSGSKAMPEREGKVSANNDLPGHILKLRGAGFFNEPKTASEVRGKLQSKYPCEQNRVAMALLRLQRRKLLRKSSKVVDKKKQIAYVW